MRAIPKKLLIHDALLLKETKGEWGSEGLREICSLKRIRIEPSSKVIRDKNNAELQLAAVMFFDCKNSKPTDIGLELDQIVDFHGEKYRMVALEALYDGSKLHHYEIGMVKYAYRNQG